MLFKEGVGFLCQDAETRTKSRYDRVWVKGIRRRDERPMAVRFQEIEEGTRRIGGGEHGIICFQI